MTVVCNKVLLIGGFSGDKNDEPHGALSGAWWGTFREEEGCEGAGEKHGDTETGKHANSHALSQTRQSAPIGGPPETFGEGLNGVRRVFGSGLGTFMGMATRGTEMPVGFQRGVRQVGFGDLSSSAKQNKTGGLSAVPTDRNALLASVLVSVERLSAASDVYPELGEEGASFPITTHRLCDCSYKTDISFPTIRAAAFFRELRFRGPAGRGFETRVAG